MFEVIVLPFSYFIYVLCFYLYIVDFFLISMYFTFSYAVSRHKDDMIVYSVLVSMLSLVCAAMIAGFAFFPGSNLVLTLISVILQLAISAVYMAHRKVVCKITNSTETLLEEQRQKLNAEYYAELGINTTCATLLSTT